MEAMGEWGVDRLWRKRFREEKSNFSFYIFDVGVKE